MRTEFQIVGGHSEEDNRLIGTGRTINMYVRPGNDERTAYLVPMPGLLKTGQTPIAQEGRLLYTDGTTLFAISHDIVYRVSIIPGSPPLFVSTGTLSTATGSIEAASNAAGETLFVDGTKGYLWNGLTFAPQTSPPFPGKPESITYLDGYFIVNEGETAKFAVSALNNGSSWDVLNFASIQSKPDVLIGITTLHRRIYLFGKVSTEVWYNAGAADFPFRRDNNLLLEYGCKAKASIATSEDKLFWLANHTNGEITVQMVEGYRPVTISDQALEDKLHKYQTTEDAIGETYEIDGHIFYELTFPTQDITWVYDSMTHLWFERQMQDRKRFVSNTYEVFGDILYALDYRDASFYEMSSSFYTYDGDAINRIRISAPFKDKMMNEVQINEFQQIILPGVGDLTDDEDPYLLLSISKDNGYIYGYKKHGKLGQIGERKQILRFYRFGMSGGNLGGTWIFKLEYYGKTDFMIGNAVIDYEVFQ